MLKLVPYSDPRYFSSVSPYRFENILECWKLIIFIGCSKVPRHVSEFVSQIYQSHDNLYLSTKSEPLDAWLSCWLRLDVWRRIWREIYNYSDIRQTALNVFSCSAGIDYLWRARPRWLDLCCIATYIVAFLAFSILIIIIIAITISHPQIINKAFADLVLWGRRKPKPVCSLEVPPGILFASGTLH